MLKYLAIFFIILACCLFALLLVINSGEWVVIGCCEKSMQKKLQQAVTPETDAPETKRLLLSD